MGSPVQLTLGIDRAKIDQITEMLKDVRNGANRAMSGAINKTLTQGRTLAARGIRDEVEIQYGRILERFKVRKSSAGSLEGHIDVSRKGIPLSDYKARQNAAGVTVKVRKSTGAEQHDHWFIATMKSGHSGVFDRKKGGAGRVGRLGIQQKFGPTAVGVLAGKPGLIQDIEAQLDIRLGRNLDSQVNRLLERKKPE